MVTTAILLPKDFISPFEYQVAPRALRRAFCSHLAMRGAPARAIQELAGHRDLATTMGCMQLSPEAKDSAIRLLETPGTGTI